MSCEDKPWIVADLYYGDKIKIGSPIWKNMMGFFYRTKEEAQEYLDSIYKKCHLDESVDYGNHVIKVMEFDDYLDIEETHEG